MSVAIYEPSGKHYEVNLALHDTVHSLKERLKAIHGVSLVDKDLYFQNIALMDSSALSSIGVSAGSKLLLSQAINHQPAAAGIPPLQKRQSVNSVQYQAAPPPAATSGTPPVANRPRLNLDKTHNASVAPQPALQYAIMGNPAPLPVSSGLPLQMPIIPVVGLNMMGVQMPVMVNPTLSGAMMPLSPLQPIGHAPYPSSAHPSPQVHADEHRSSLVSNPFDDVEKALSRKKAAHPIPDHLFESTVPLDKEREYLEEVKRKLDRAKTVPIRIKAERSRHSNDSSDVNSPTTPRQPQQSSRGSTPSPRHSISGSSVPNSSTTHDTASHSQTHSVSLSATSLLGLQPATSGHYSPSNSPRPASRETVNSSASSSSASSNSSTSIPPLQARSSLIMSSSGTQHRRLIELEFERKELDERLHKQEEEQQDKLKQLQSFINQIQSERSVSVALLQSQKLKFDANFESLKEKLKEEEEKTAKTLAPWTDQIRELEEKISAAQKKLKGSKESEEEQRKKCQDNIHNLRRTLGALSSGRDAVEYDQDKRKKETAATVCSLLEEGGIEDEVWKELNERRQRRVAEIIARTTTAPFTATSAPSSNLAKSAAAS